MKLAEVKLILDDKIKELKDTYAKRSQSLTDTFRLLRFCKASIL